MSEFNKYSTDGGATFIDVEDSKAVHWGDQSKGYVGKNLFFELAPNITVWGSNKDGFSRQAYVNAYSAVAKVENNKNYIVSKNNIGNKFRIIGFVDYPNLGTVYSNAHEIYNDASKTEATINSEIYNYIVLVCNFDAIVSGDYNAMIRLSSITDNTYEPYIHPNTEIVDKMTYDANSVLGSTNMLKNTGTDIVATNYSFIVNDDKSVTLNSTTNTDSPDFNVHIYNATDFPFDINKKYRLTGCPLGGNSDTNNGYRLDIVGENGISWGIQDVGVGKDFYFPQVPTGNQKYKIRICLRQKIVTDLVFFPMITVAGYTGNYVKYAATNNEITDIIDNQLINATAHSITAWDSAGVIDACQYISKIMKTYSLRFATVYDNAYEYMAFMTKSFLQIVGYNNAMNTKREVRYNMNSNTAVVVVSTLTPV